MDLPVFPASVTAAFTLYAVLTLRQTAKRLHYEDRPLFWQKVRPLLAGLAAASILLLAGLFLRINPPFWIAMICAFPLGVGAFFLSQNPRQILRRHPRHQKS